MQFIADDPELNAIFSRTCRDILKKIMDEAQTYYEFIDPLNERGFRFETSGKITYFSEQNKDKKIVLDIDKDLHLQTSFEMMIERIKKKNSERKKRKKVIEVVISQDSLDDFFSEEDMNDEVDVFIAQDTANNKEKYRQQLMKIAENKKSEAKHSKTHILKK
jgi:hypothetical protein